MNRIFLQNVVKRASREQMCTKITKFFTKFKSVDPSIKDPSCALSDSEVEMSHRPAQESKSVPTLGYLSDPESEQSRVESESSQKVIVEWKWGELPETKDETERTPSAISDHIIHDDR